MAKMRILEHDAEIISSFAVMKQLRPHLDEKAYLATVRKLQSEQNYHLLALFVKDQIKALAGYRIVTNLAWGTHLYVDDLVTDENSRGNGYAQQLFNWLEEEANKKHCQQLHLDSGVQRHDAHRFYLKNRMVISSHHFQKFC